MMMNYGMRSIFVAAVVCTSTAAAQDTGVEAMSVRLQIDKRVVRGLPALATLSITHELVDVEAQAEGVSRDTGRSREGILLSELAFPLFDVLDTEHPLSISVKDETGNSVLEARRPDEKAFKNAYFNHEWPTFLMYRERVGVPPGMTKSFVADLGAVLEDVAPGTYELEVLLYAYQDADPWRSNSVPIEVITLSPPKLAELKGAATLITGPAEETFTLAWLGAGVDQRFDRAADSVKPLLSLHAFLSAVLRTGDAKRAPISLLDHLPSHLSGLRESLLYEVSTAQERLDEANLVAEKIRSEFPDVEWRLERVRRGKGLVQRVLKLSRE